MKKYLTLLLLCLIGTTQINAQCIPMDCPTYTGLFTFGGICDTNIATGLVNTPYLEQESFRITNACFKPSEIDTTQLDVDIRINNIDNFVFGGLPNGLTAATDQPSYNTGSGLAVGCVGVSGIPTEAGLFAATIDVLGDITSYPFPNPFNPTPCSGISVPLADQAFSFSLDLVILPDPSFNILAASYCQADAPVTLTPLGTLGGTFSGPGVVGNTFDPGLAGPGTHTIMYTVTAQEGLAVGPATNASSQTLIVEASTIYFVDGDMDSYGDPNNFTETCDPQPPGTSLIDGDCDDTNEFINPDATEICDGVDNNCDALTDGEDASLLSAICQDVTVQLDATGIVLLNAADFDNGSLDACGTATFSVSPSGFTCNELGPNAVTLTLQASGNVSNCNATATVEDPLLACVDPCDPDLTSPTALCQNITIQLDGSGNASVTPNDIDNGSNDACGPVTLQIADSQVEQFNCGQLGGNTSTLTVTDGNGNASTCTASVTVQDLEPPTISCPPAITVDTDPGTCTVTGLNPGTPTTADNCGIASITNDANEPLAFTYNKITWTVVDNSGISSTCEQDISIEDNEPPTISCPADITVQTDPGQCSSIFSFSVPSDDFCPGAQLIQTNGQGSGSAFPLGPTLNSFTVTDASNNSTSCSFTVTVEDNEPPTISCPADITVQTDPGQCSSIFSFSVPSDDFCPGAQLIQTNGQGSGSAFPLGPTLNSFTVTDASNNSTSCSFTVTVEDNEPPTIACPADITVQTDPGQCSSIFSFSVPSDDFCPGAQLIQTNGQGSGSAFPLGPTLNSFTVTDASNNSTSCSFTVTVEDNEPPTISCPADITVQTDPGQCSSIFSFSIPSEDFCPGAQLIQTNGQGSGSAFSLGSTLNSFTVTDASNNSTSCSFTVTVEDNEPPVAICQDITIQLDGSGNGSVTALQIDDGSSDTCPFSVEIVGGGSGVNFTCGDLGANPIALSITDGSGNTSTCTSIITVEDPTGACFDPCDPDNDAPTANCQNITIQLDGTGNASIVPGDVDAGSFDDCGGVALSVSSSTFDCSNVGITGFGIDLFVTDDAGNTTTCSADIFVEDPLNACFDPCDPDNTPPTANCQDITIDLDAGGLAFFDPQLIDNFSNDACGPVSLSADASSFDCSSTGANDVILTVTDDNANTSSCTAVVTVNDVTPPIAVCQDITVELDATGNASIVAADIDGGSSDACGVTLSVAPFTFNCGDLGTVAVTLGVFDPIFNNASCIANVTVIDLIAPAVNCALGIDVNTDPGQCSANVIVPPPAVLDNCDDVDPILTLDGLSEPGTFITDVSLGAFDQILVDLPLNATILDVRIGVDVSHTWVSDVDLGLFAPSGSSILLLSRPINCSNDNMLILFDDAAALTAAGLDGWCMNTDPWYSGSAQPLNPLSTFDGQDPSGLWTFYVQDFAENDNGTINAWTLHVDYADPGGRTSTFVVERNLKAERLVEVDLSINESLSYADKQLAMRNAPGSSAITNVINDYNGTSDASDNYSVGTTTVIWTATDESGNSNQCTQLVTVSDNEAPNAVCQDITVEINETGGVCVSAQDIDGGSNDACGIELLRLPGITDACYSCGDLGVQSLTLEVLDVNGNLSSCVANVTVEDPTGLCTDPCDPDITPPTAICQDITIQLDGSGNASITPQDIDAGSNDACGGVVLDIADAQVAQFTCSEVGTNTVLLTVGDANGNESNCTAIVEVEDNIPPVALCQDITVELDGNGTVTVAPEEVNAGSDDPCGFRFDMLADSDANFTCSHVGNNTVTLLVTDDSDNVSSCTATVAVQDNIAPIALCQDVTLQLDANGIATITAQDADAGSSDACGIGSLLIENSEFVCISIRSTGDILQVTDNNGNTSTCAFTITIVDDIFPVAICQDITVELDASGNATISPNQLDGGSSDNCSIASLSADILSFACTPGVGESTTQVTLTATDDDGNSSSCTANVTAQDNTPPVALCHEGLVFELGANGIVNFSPDDLDNGSSDECGLKEVVIVGHIVGEEMFTCAELGTNSVTLLVTDDSDNSSSCTVDVSVVDNIPPTALCKNITVQLDANGDASSAPADLNDGSFDNCVFQNNETNLDFWNCSHIGPNPVTFSIEDLSGNSASCTALVTVEDNSPPTALCQNITVQLDVSGEFTLNALALNDGSTDNCSVAFYALPEVDDEVLVLFCSDLGVNPILLEVSDNTGNSSVCTALVTVEDPTGACIEPCNPDVTPPNASCQDITIQLDANGEGSLSATDVDAGSSDACGPVSIFIEEILGSLNLFCSDIGSEVFTLTAEDLAGNSASCSATVTVEDNIAPTANCQDVTVQLDANGMASVTATELNDNSTDNCGIGSLLILDTTPPTVEIGYLCHDVGTDVVILGVTDVNGNSSNCTSTITIEDNLPPTAICNDLTVELEADGQAFVLASEGTLASSDNCGDITSFWDDSELLTGFTCDDIGSFPAVLTVEDQSGNSSICTSTINVVDVTPPLVTCQDMTVQLDITGNATILRTDFMSASDFCELIPITGSVGFNCASFEVGTFSSTYGAFDASGNQGTCVVTFTVEDPLGACTDPCDPDETPPTAICNDVTAQLDENGTAIVTALQIGDGSSDACGPVTLGITADGTIDPENAFTCSNIGANTVTLTATDNSGNSSNCTASVLVEDNLPPVISIACITFPCPSNVITASANEFECGTNILLEALGLDNCNVAQMSFEITYEDLQVTCSTTVNTGITADEFFPVGNHIICFSAQDGSGNTSTNCVSVIVVDDTPPVAECQDLTVELNPNGQATVPASDATTASSDNCGDITSFWDDSELLVGFTCDDIGSFPAILTVEDQSGNSSVCTSTISVVDVTPPTAVCNDLTVQLNANGVGAINPADLAIASSDACTPLIFASDIIVSCVDVGTIQIDVINQDIFGNSSTCTSNVTVEDPLGACVDPCDPDETPPTALCQDITVVLDENGIGAFTAEDVDNGSFDACGLLFDVAVNFDDIFCSAGDLVTLTATDLSGNSSTCTSLVFGMDNSPPVALCQDITIQLDANGEAQIVPEDIDNGSSDACGIENYQLSNSDFDCNTTTDVVILTILDMSGNTSNCSATVTVEDPNGFCDNDGCTTPENLYATDITFFQATLGWDAVPGAIRYQAEGRIKGGPFGITRRRIVQDNVFRTNALFPFLTYQFRVRTDCPATGWSGWSDWFDFTLNPFAVTGEDPIASATRDIPVVDLFDTDKILSIYPNPSDGFIKLQYAGDELNGAEISITDLAGRYVYYEILDWVNGEEKSIDLRSIENGMYLINLVKDGVPLRTEKVIFTE